MASHTIYRRPTPNGDLYRQIVGLSLGSSEEGATTATFEIAANRVREAGMGEPVVGDQVCDQTGRWWEVTSVGEVKEDGFHTLDCAEL